MNQGVMRWRGIIVALAITAALVAAALAGEVTVAWTFATNNVDGTPLTDLAGAKVYYGTTSSNYTRVVDVPGGAPGQTKSHTVTGLVDGVRYYLNGTAYNTAGLESDFCREVAKVAKNSSPQVPGPNDALAVLVHRRQIMVIRNQGGRYVPLVMWQAWDDALSKWVDE